MHSVAITQSQARLVRCRQLVSSSTTNGALRGAARALWTTISSTCPAGTQRPARAFVTGLAACEFGDEDPQPEVLGLEPLYLRLHRRAASGHSQPLQHGVRVLPSRPIRKPSAGRSERVPPIHNPAGTAANLSGGPRLVSNRNRNGLPRHAEARFSLQVADATVGLEPATCGLRVAGGAV